ncbi:MAG: hypothetical protein ACLR4X_11435 [Clostridia bacterium]
MKINDIINVTVGVVGIIIGIIGSIITLIGIAVSMAGMQLQPRQEQPVCTIGDIVAIEGATVNINCIVKKIAY